MLASLFGLPPAEGDDLELLAAIYVVAVGFLLWSYVLAGYVWVERHSVHYTTEKGEQRVSGFWGELFLFTACALVVVVALAFTSVDFTDIFVRHAGGVALGFVAVFMIYLIYAFSVVRAAKKEGKNAAYQTCLRNAYCAYAVYSVIFFACGALVVVLLGFEFYTDKAAFDAQAAEVLNTLRQAQTASLSGQIGASLAYLEDANGGVAMATNTLQDQMNPTFLFAACVFAVNVLLVATPVKNVFLKGAAAITQVTTAVAIGCIILIGLLIYFGSYTVLIEDALQMMAGVRPDPALGEWEATRRFNEIVVELNARRNLLGFAGAISGEGSGIALFAGGIQFAVDRVAGGGKTTKTLH